MTPQSIDSELTAEFLHALEWTDRLFRALTLEGFYQRPIPLRHPCIFYYGHLPAFAWNHIFRKTLGWQSFNPEFDELFERGIDPSDMQGTGPSPRSVATGESPHFADKWPSLERISDYKQRIETELLGLLASSQMVPAGEGPLLGTLNMVLEHYLMHIETFVYMLHQLDPKFKKPLLIGKTATPGVAAAQSAQEKRLITGGSVTLGALRSELDFGWCNEFSQITANVQPFLMDKLATTNGDFLEFVEAGGYSDPQWWSPDGWEWVQRFQRKHPEFWEIENKQWLFRSFSGPAPLVENAPAWVTMCEAQAFSKWKGAALPSEAQFHRAAYGTNDEEQMHPWGDDEPSFEHGNFGLENLDPQPVGAHPQGDSFFGVSDLIGNGWEWTRSHFAPFPGFEPLPTYPGYSADFFDGNHFVLKGGSPVTSKRLLRRSFRNWFQPHYPYMYAKFRCVYEDKAA